MEFNSIERRSPNRISNDLRQRAEHLAQLNEAIDRNVQAALQSSAAASVPTRSPTNARAWAGADMGDDNEIIENKNATSTVSSRTNVPQGISSRMRQPAASSTIQENYHDAGSSMCAARGSYDLLHITPGRTISATTTCSATTSTAPPRPTTML